MWCAGLLQSLIVTLLIIGHPWHCLSLVILGCTQDAQSKLPRTSSRKSCYDASLRSNYRTIAGKAYANVLSARL